MWSCDHQAAYEWWQQYRSSHGAMRVIIMNGLARKTPWGSREMTAMPPLQGWLCG